MQCGVWGQERGQRSAASEAHLGPACMGQCSGWGGVLQAVWGGTGFLSRDIQKNCKWVFKATRNSTSEGPVLPEVLWPLHDSFICSCLLL